jgi:hypothetical protein
VKRIENEAAIGRRRRKKKMHIERVRKKLRVQKKERERERERERGSISRMLNMTGELGQQGVQAREWNI